MTNRLALTCAATAAAMVFTGCASNTNNGTRATGEISGAAAAIQAAKAALPGLEAGTSVLPDSTTRPIKRGMRVALLSAGQNNLSAAGPINGAADACKAAGWTCDVFDGASDPTKYAALVNQIAASNYNGIIDVGIDCPLISTALTAAKAKGIKIISAYAFDCNDPKYHGARQFDAEVLYGNHRTAAQQFQAFGEAQGTAIIALTGGHQQVLHVVDDEFRILDYIAQGMESALSKDPTTAITGTLNIKAADLVTGRAAQEIGSMLIKNPSASVITVPYVAAGLAAVYPALQTTHKAGKIFVQGAEGQAPELDLVRSGVASFVNISSPEWTGWAAVDTLNSVFSGQPVRSSGLGFTIVTKDNATGATGTSFSDLPAFKNAYLKAWGLA